MDHAEVVEVVLWVCLALLLVDGVAFGDLVLSEGELATGMCLHFIHTL